MTIWADKEMSIQTVIVIVGDTAVGYLLFQPVKKIRGRTAKEIQSAFASMASVAKCLLARALALPETLLK